MNTTAVENKVDLHYSQSTLQSIKEKLIAADTINQLDIADGLKELLISNGFTIRLLQKNQHQNWQKFLALMIISLSL